ncbi:MAG TPA: TIR domain-containing protein, partial [Pyrinomonadaceae bacterium]|nr:TIR domain-containing protein [Pyrinomonadaceae bacterium]
MSAASKEKRLVFISVSGSKEDYWWRDRLKTKLVRYPDIEWWDDFIVTFDDLEARENAIRRASVAVILLSPAYLSSEDAISELNKLKSLAEAEKKPRLFPII